MRRSLVFVLTLIFVFAMFAGPAAPRADAVVVSSIVVGTVIAAMAAAGIGLSVSGMTSSQLTDWVGGKLNDWATSLGGSIEDHIDGNLITMTAGGIISIGTAAVQGISGFISWLTTDLQLTNNSSTQVVQGGLKIAGLYANYGRTQTYKWPRYPLIINCTATEDVYWVVCKGHGSEANWYFLYALSPDKTFSVTSDQFGTNNSYVLNGYNVGYIYVTAGWETEGIPPLVLNQFEVADSMDEYLQSYNGTKVETDGSLSVDTQVIETPTVQEGDKWFIDVGAAPGTTIQTATDGVIADTIEGDLTVSGEVAEEEPEFVVDEPIAVSGLTEVFPFCIPFDIYALLSSLSADPQTPVFTVRFVVPGIIDQEFTIDLTPFNAVAQIVRTMELLAFIIGLALVTRERFLRS